MNAMRLTLPSYNPVKECQGCTLRDENKVAAHILSYQLAEHLLKRFSGTWQLADGEIKLRLAGVEQPLRFDLNTGTLGYGTLRTSITARYSVEKGIAALIREISQDLMLPASESKGYEDPLFSLFVKLVEIFHARCGLNILPVETDQHLQGWELALCEEGPRGWISTEGIAENRFGERADIKEWYTLRPEKMAAYVFGFNKFCGNYPSPFKTIK
jgi:hypothetical protein